MNCFSNNGRVDILDSNTKMPFSLQDKIPLNDCTSFRDAMIGNWEDSILSKTFFSAENIHILQNGIRAGVHKKSRGQYVIGPQNCDTLKIIMRSIYLQSASNLPTHITEQIQALNQLVLDYTIPQVYGEAEGYIQYKKDVSTMYIPLPHPIYANYDDKTLELKKWF